MIRLVAFLVAIVIVSCSPIVSNYTSSCPRGDEVCQRNQNAQTLAIIGQEEAAAQLMRTDPDIGYIIGDCNGG